MFSLISVVVFFSLHQIKEIRHDDRHNIGQDYGIEQIYTESIKKQMNY